MLVCEAPELVPWRPDFSTSGQDDPDWTKLVCGGIELCNTLEAANWTDEWAVQVDVCDACGYIHCRSGGWVHVSRLGSHVLWTPPDIAPHEYRVSRNGRPAISAGTARSRSRSSSGNGGASRSLRCPLRPASSGRAETTCAAPGAGPSGSSCWRRRPTRRRMRPP